MKFDKHHYFYLFSAFLFLGIIAVPLFSDGMFMDGLFYADIARNMAEGYGSFWKPHFSDTLFNDFYEHPPLAMGLQSIGFRLFGDSIYVERFYSLLTFVIVSYIMILLWKKLTGSKKYGWMPLLLWFITGGVAWTAENNMLENTMSIFVSLAFYFSLKTLDDKRFLWLALSGISLALGLLSKGFVCLYIWTVPFFAFLFLKKRNFLQMTVDTFAIIIFTVLPIVGLYFFIPEAKNNMTHYFNSQVLDSIQNVQTVNSRFTILGLFLKAVSIPLAVALILVVACYFRKKDIKPLLKEHLHPFGLFSAVTLAGVLPIMLSMKQSFFYISTVYPFFSLGLAYFLYPLAEPIFENIPERSRGFKVFKVLSVSIVVAALFLSVAQINRVGRERETISDTKAVIAITGRNCTINICPEMRSNWPLHGYFSRYGNVSLESNQAHICPYFLSSGDCKQNLPTEEYELLDIKTQKYKLYKRKLYSSRKLP